MDNFVIENGVLKEYLGDEELVVIPSEVKRIGYKAFDRKYSIRKIDLANVEYIEDRAFWYLRGLESLTIPDSVYYLGAESIYGCESLTEVKFESTRIRTIKENTFLNCGLLERIEVPDGVEVIEKGAFYECEQLSTISLPASLKEVDTNAFECSYNLENIEWRGTVAQFNEVQFGCHGESRVIDDHEEVYFNLIIDGKVVREIEIDSALSIGPGIKELALDKIVIKNVKEICNFALYCSSVKEVVFGQGVEVLGDSVLSESSNLEKVTFSSDLKKIGKNAFFYCYALKEIIVPDSVEELGESAFGHCAIANKIVLPSKLLKIPSALVWSCGNLRSITIPKTVKYIGADAFEDCEKLESITIPPSVKYIGKYAFSCCKSIKKIHIPASVSKIKDCVFSECVSLEKISVSRKNKHYCSKKGNLYTLDGSKLIAYAGGKNEKEFVIPSCVRTIGENAFARASVGRVYVPNTVTRINSKAFWICQTDEVRLPEGLKEIGESCFSYSTVWRVQLPKTLQVIKENAFNSCMSLEKITLPNGLKRIENSAFRQCESLEKIIIPDSVTKVGHLAFDGCSNLKKVEISSAKIVCGQKIDEVFDVRPRSGFNKYFSIDDEKGYVIVIKSGKAQIKTDRKTMTIDLRSQPISVLPNERLRENSLKRFAYNVAQGIKYPKSIMRSNVDYAKTKTGWLIGNYESPGLLALYCSNALISVFEALKILQQMNDNTDLDVRLVLLDYLNSFSEQEREKAYDESIKFD